MMLSAVVAWFSKPFLASGLPGARSGDNQLLSLYEVISGVVNAAEVMEGPPLKRRKTRSDLAGPAPRLAPRPSSQATHRKPKTPRDDGGRSVRPRPLHINDKVSSLPGAALGIKAAGNMHIILSNIVICFHMLEALVPDWQISEPTWNRLQMRVLWQGRDPEWDELDGGAFARWLQSCDDAAQAKAIKEAEPSAKAQVRLLSCPCNPQSCPCNPQHLRTKMSHHQGG